MSYNKNPYFDECDFEEKCDYEEPKCCEIEKCEPKCHKHRKTSLLEAVSLTPQTVAAGAAVPFTTNLVTQGFGIIHTPGGTDFNLLQPGIYEVTFTGQVTTTDAATVAAVALAVNGTILPGTSIAENVVAGQAAALATQALIQVSPFISTVLTVVNPTGSPEVFTNPNIIIERIG